MPEKKSWSNPSMMLITSNWGPSKTFKLIPTVIDCPYIEAIFNPTAKVLAVIGKTNKNTFHMVERLDENGDARKRKGVVNKEEPNQKQRVSLDTYAEYYIVELDEIEDFIKRFSINSKDFDYKSHFEAQTMDPSTNGITKMTPEITLDTKV
jgi:hypothetical protein